MIIYPGRVEFGPDFYKNPDPVRVFLKKTQTRPYSLSSRVKSDPLGSSRAGYPQVGQKLPSLCPQGGTKVFVMILCPIMCFPRMTMQYLAGSSYLPFRSLLFVLSCISPPLFLPTPSFFVSFPFYSVPLVGFQ